MLESHIKSSILLRLGQEPDLMLWNHPTGVARALQPPHPVLRFGCPGSPDIIGCMAVTIPPHWVGRRVGLAIGIEVKTATGRLRYDQDKFHRAWTERASGLVTVARSSDQAADFISQLRADANSNATEPNAP